MGGIQITPNAVAISANTIAQRAMTMLASEADTCGSHGYHAYATELMNMRQKIERALHELTDHLCPDESGG